MSGAGEGEQVPEMDQLRRLWAKISSDRLGIFVEPKSAMQQSPNQLNASCWS